MTEDHHLDLRCPKCGRWLTEIVGTKGRAKCCGWEIVVTHKDHHDPDPLTIPPPRSKLGAATASAPT